MGAEIWVRLLEELRGCHARVNLLVTADETDTRHSWARSPMTFLRSPTQTDQW